MRRSALALAGIASICLVAPAQAQERHAFDIAAGTLDRALVRFARQAGLSVDVSDPALRRVRTRGLRGTYRPDEGLRRLLQGTEYDFRIDNASRVIRLARRTPAPVPRPTSAPRTAVAPTPPAPPPSPPEPIIVEATKLDGRLSDYPGAIHLAELDPAESLRFGGGGSELLLRELPNLSSTDLGSGRNKIFIRGVADSSFNGQTQATISQYLDDSRLTYSAPDPNLLLYDVASFEVLEGAQGTLYGAGSLGGVIRISPRSPELGTTSLSGTAALVITGDDPGGELALVGNLPLTGNSAARVVAYGMRRPGYINDPGRGLNDINSTEIMGLRASLLAEPAPAWTVEAGMVLQQIHAMDGQYTDSGTNALTRSAAIDQPFFNDYLLFHTTARAALGFARLTSTTSFATQSINSHYDATRLAGGIPTTFVEDRDIALFAHETRLNGSSGPLASWVGGLAIANSSDRVRQFLGPVDDPAELSELRSTTLDAALFGEATMGPWHNFSLTLGGRLSWVRQADELIVGPAVPELEPRRNSLRALPTAALSWTPREGLIVYARYREGYRPGAVQVTGSGADAAAERFEADDIATSEVGLRFGIEGQSHLWGGLLFSYSRWDQIQADLVTQQGFPYVANLGSGFVRYGSLDLGWSPLDGLALEASGFMTTSQLDRPTPAFASAGEEDLPNIADEGFRLSANYRTDIGQAQLDVGGTVGYVGASFLAIGAPLELSQGKYYDTALGARVQFGDWGVSLDIDNVLDTTGNRFSYGNPFEVAGAMQRTPLRPRTIRLGIDAQF